MNRHLLFAPSVILSLLSVAGCRSDVEEITETAPAVVAFEGKPDERFVAIWKTEDGASTYRLSQDGGFKMDGKVKTPNGTMENHIAGNWAVKDDLMLFKDGQGQVVPYKYSLDGKKLKLSLTGRMKRETVLIRQ